MKTDLRHYTVTQVIEGFVYNELEGKGLFGLADGQQRVTSVGRFVTGKFAIRQDGKEQTFSSLPVDEQEKILKSTLLVWGDPFCVVQGDREDPWEPEV